MSKYNIQTDGNKVTCTSHYASKPYVGVAKCNPNDKFDEEIGIALAKFRCDLKIEEKRLKSRREKLVNLDKQIDELQKRKEKFSNEYYKSKDDYRNILFNYSRYYGKFKSEFENPVVFKIPNITSANRNGHVYPVEVVQTMVTNEGETIPIVFEEKYLLEDLPSRCCVMPNKIIGHATSKYLSDTDTLEVTASFINIDIKDSFINNKLTIAPIGIGNIGDDGVIYNYNFVAFGISCFSAFDKVDKP